MRRVALLAGVVGLLLAASAWAEEKKAKDDAKSIEGTWQVVAMESAGQKLPEDQVKNMKLVLKDGKYTMTVGDEKDVGTFKLDQAKKPKTVDATSTEGDQKGRTILGIYELDGDTFKSCYEITGGERPKEFKTKEGTSIVLITFKRVKQ